MRPTRRIALILLIVYWIAIFAATHAPTRRWPAGPKNPSDKLAHYGAFAGLTLLLGWTFSGRQRPKATTFQLYFLAAAAYAVVDELTQAPIEGRTPEFADWLADLLGAASGLGLYNLSRIAVVGLFPSAPAPASLPAEAEKPPLDDPPAPLADEEPPARFLTYSPAGAENENGPPS